MKQILCEYILPTAKPLTEEKSGDGFLYLKGLFVEGELQNHNGRTYPRDEIGKAVASLNERIEKFGPVAGELDHPEGLNVNFDRVRHVITKMFMEGNNGLGTMRVINAGMGLIVKAASEAGMLIGVRSRGSGSVGNNGMVSDFDIVTIDIVANPSAPHAYPKASLAEQIRRDQHGNAALTLTECMQNDPAAQKYLTAEINKFLTSIRDEVAWRRK